MLGKHSFSHPMHQRKNEIQKKKNIYIYIYINLETLNYKEKLIMHI